MGGGGEKLGRTNRANRIEKERKMGGGSGGDRRKGAMVFCVRTRQLSLGAYFSRGIVSQFHLIASSMEGQQIGDIRVKMLKRKGGGEEWEVCPLITI